MAYVTAGLALPKASSNDSDVATKSHLLLRCPREGGVYFLDAIIEHVASLARADVVRIDPQDLEEMAGDFLGDTKYSSLSNITSQKLRSLGYDAQSQSQGVVMAREENQEEEEEEEEYRDSTETQATPCFTASTISSIAGLRALAVAVPILPGSVASNLLLPAVSPQTRDSDRRNEQKVYRLLEALIDAAATKRTQQDLAQTYIDPWHGDPGAPRDISQPPDATLQHQKTIIHLREYIELQRTPQGATIIRMMHDIVSRKRSQGIPMMIIGTTSSCETSYSLQKGNIEMAQELSNDAFERTILVPPAKAPTDDDLDSILEFDWRARIREVNIRHLRDIIRRRSGDGQRSIELDVPRDWHFLAEVAGEGEPHIAGIDEDMWSFDRAQRVAVMAIGLYHKHFQSLRVLPQPQLVEFQENEPDCQDVPLSEHDPEYIPGILTLRNIASAVDAISQSDNFKFSWAATERRRLHIIEKEEKQNASQTEDEDADDLTELGIKKPKAASSELMKKLAKTCTPHEQKLLGGVINPEKLHVGFNSVRAPPETIETLKVLTSLSLIRPEAFQYGVLATDRIPGVLLYGPPGTGKTLLAKAVAKESGATVLEVSGSEIFDMYVGEGEKNVKAIFSLATRLSPCVIFLDEADAILGSRSSSGTRTTHREIINQFLREWADLPMTPSSNTFLMVATNRPFDLDDAVLRRLPRRILVDLPSAKDRLEILKIHLKDESLDPGVDLERIAKATPLYSGSDLKNVCVSAALSAVREEHDKFVKEGVKWGRRRVLTKKHFDKALAEVGASVGEDMGSLAQMRKWDEKFGEGKGRKRSRGMGFGNIGLGVKEGEVDEGAGRVRKPLIY